MMLAKEALDEALQAKRSAVGRSRGRGAMESAGVLGRDLCVLCVLGSAYFVEGVLGGWLRPRCCCHFLSPAGALDSVYSQAF